MAIRMDATAEEYDALQFEVHLYWKKTVWKNSPGVLLYNSARGATDEVGDYSVWFLSGAVECCLFGLQGNSLYLGLLEDLDPATPAYGSMDQYLAGDWHRAKLMQSQWFCGIQKEYRAVDMFTQGPRDVGSGVWAWTTLLDTYDPDYWSMSKRECQRGIWTFDDGIMTQPSMTAD